MGENVKHRLYHPTREHREGQVCGLSHFASGPIGVIPNLIQHTVQSSSVVPNPYVFLFQLVSNEDVSHSYI